MVYAFINFIIVIDSATRPFSHVLYSPTTGTGVRDSLVFPKKIYVFGG